MECTKCHAVNEVSASRCEKCGAPLQFYERRDHFWGNLIFMVFMVLLICAGGFVYFSEDIFPRPEQVTQKKSAAGTERSDIKEKKKRLRI